MLVCVEVEAEVMVRFTVTGSSSKRTMVGDVLWVYAIFSLATVGGLVD
jgi:hypothetical protein